MQEIRARLREARKGAKLTQASLGELTGVSQDAVSRMELHARAIDAEWLAVAAQVLQRPIEWFYGEPTAASRLPHQQLTQEQQRTVELAEHALRAVGLKQATVLGVPGPGVTVGLEGETEEQLLREYRTLGSGRRQRLFDYLADLLAGQEAENRLRRTLKTRQEAEG
jgi:transcriptional regulator with XRE-family HTH domain